MSGSMILERSACWRRRTRLSKTISNVQAVGTDEVNGERARVYTYTSTYIFGEAGADQIISQVKLWVSEKRGLPVKRDRRRGWRDQIQDRTDNRGTMRRSPSDHR
ncbi:hypothetical protein [Candidatus Amarolinea dominans]|uniref:hypothetical protein n=1 Tax=Candidatus Amarolinea dominans TaxID=3140696 RepID=UPI001E0555BD|nr:hypothetical protein [Anaerolineae bacterium]